MDKNKFRYCTLLLIDEYNHGRIFISEKNKYYIKGDNKWMHIQILDKFGDIKKPYRINVIDTPSITDNYYKTDDATDNYYKNDRFGIKKYFTILLIDDDDYSKIFIPKKFFTILVMIVIILVLMSMIIFLIFDEDYGE